MTHIMKRARTGSLIDNLAQVQSIWARSLTRDGGLFSALRSMSSVGQFDFGGPILTSKDVESISKLAKQSPPAASPTTARSNRPSKAGALPDGTSFDAEKVDFGSRMLTEKDVQDFVDVAKNTSSNRKGGKSRP